ncbi:hypothetical protein EVAR_83814_1 [Eumeta japonica]|uniref:Uncharacterized protein n=1 Tax=Eumeta variegata TaxID=151549 RepID=A0A4C1WID1_EUMVA|nr:hypothetical protein EVAR_83814_1 [Eumeta japonica]
MPRTKRRPWRLRVRVASVSVPFSAPSPHCAAARSTRRAGRRRTRTVLPPGAALARRLLVVYKKLDLLNLLRRRRQPSSGDLFTHSRSHYVGTRRNSHFPALSAVDDDATLRL